MCITFSGPPIISIPLSDKKLIEGETVLFEATITGKPSPDIVWLKDEKPIDSPNASTSSSEKKHVLQIENCSLLDKGLYSITASNLAGEAHSNCHLLVNQPPSYDKELVDTVTVSGHSCEFAVISNGIPEPVLTWYKDDIEIINDDHFTLSSMGNLHSLVIKNVSLHDRGKITVEAKNEVGSAYTSAYHTVHGEILDFTTRIQCKDSLDNRDIEIVLL